MSYNLLIEPIAPFRHKSGASSWLTVPEIAAGLDNGDYAVEPDWPRPDLNIATYELLIGLLSVAMAPHRHAEWRELWQHPPSPRDLAAALEPLAPAFNLDGDGPLFLQEAGLEGEANPIEALFIDTPGANGQKKNSDLLTHRGRYRALSLPAAAMALYAMQAFAPSGGAGNMTSMRGGGPLTALVVPAGEDPDEPISLWHKLWANVAVRDAPAPKLEMILPWLNAGLPLGKGKAAIHQDDPSFHPLHTLFGMPRRLRLVFSEKGGICSLTGRPGPVATGFVQKPYGLNYGLWQHPLTPYRRQKEGAEPYSAKPKAGRFGYRDWVAASLGDRGSVLRIPAANVQEARGSDRRRALTANWEKADARIRVAGWAMSNMEAISYLVAEEPLHLADIDQAEDLDELARCMAASGELVSGELRRAVANALFSSRAKPSADRGVFEQLRNDFFERTNDAFHDLLDAALARAGEGDGAIDKAATGTHWIAGLRRAALALFDAAAPVPLDDAERAVRVVKARGYLLAALTGRSKAGAYLFKEFSLPVPEKRQQRKEEEPA